ncbi:hypothetical protein [Erwinia amylovora]|uniref:Uncharacterized protein n=4 Tax=Erwinia amylovora TaxID=552 RepID=A0A830ZY03_ERWAM|nr:hypothetical protein [Erwinia amylovora]CBX79297.1 hypothetical protein EAIL5_0477 [Erwinia amylovora ATCC BAA-2158]CCP01779.1 hypothetical protein BN439_0690 [Erwinia amylovora Ea644]CDK14085.1 hypothetical protein LA635_0461 [Erwinia amylovora LA635]CDK17452.1 hypothetical protein LA636_0460 [Erwinia amylovora LA636]CDK20821.1 hypothetical protein LA637_0461 [Erwinia amylovora LA637]
MKWQTVSISLLLATLVTLLVAALIKQLPGQQEALITPQFAGEDLQLGYYDLLSRQREVYDTSIDSNGKTSIMTLTSPNDSRFVLKIYLQQHNSAFRGVTFDYQLVYFAESHQARMIKSILGDSGRNGIAFVTVRSKDKRLLVTPSGQIYSYY